MTEVRKLIDYYVSVDDGDHMDIVSFNDHIFPALASYYETINEGSMAYRLALDDDESETPWIEVEMGAILFTGDENGIDGDEEMESMINHKFPEAD